MIDPKQKITYLLLLFLIIYSPMVINAQNQHSTANVTDLKSEIEWSAENHVGAIQIEPVSLLLDDNGIPEKGVFEIDFTTILNTDIDYELMRKVLENTLKSPEWFDIENHPYGYFEIVSFEATANASIFYVQGSLQIKEIKNKISFIAFLSRDKGVYHIQTECIPFNRLLWKIDTWSAKTHKEDELIVSDIFNIEVNIKYSLQ